MFRKFVMSLFSMLFLGVTLFTYFNIDNEVVLADTAVNGDIVDVAMDSDVDYKKLIDGYRSEYNNQDIVGRVAVLNSDFDKIIVQGSDNSYYLSHDNYGRYSALGSAFVDSRVDINNARKILIFGHNTTKRKGVFSMLEEYYDYDYYKEHEIIALTTDMGGRYYKIFSVYIETSDWSYMRVDFPSNIDFIKHANMLKDNSFYDTSVDLSDDDNILILQTCSNHKDYRTYKKKYLLIIAKEMKDFAV